MKHVATLLGLLLLAACNRAPSGTYVAVLENGEVPRSGNGQPRVTLSLDNGQAIFRMGNETTLLQYKVADDTLYLTEPNQSRAEPLRIDGDRLVGDEMSFRKL